MSSGQVVLAIFHRNIRLRKYRQRADYLVRPMIISRLTLVLALLAYLSKYILQPGEGDVISEVFVQDIYLPTVAKYTHE